MQTVCSQDVTISPVGTGIALPGGPRVGDQIFEDAEHRLAGQVQVDGQLLQPREDSTRLIIVLEALSVARSVIERDLAAMAEGRVPEIMYRPDRLDH